MYTVKNIEFNEWEKNLPWVKIYERLIAKTPLVAQDYHDFMGMKSDATKMHCQWAEMRQPDMLNEQVIAKFEDATANLRGILSNPISEFEELVIRLNKTAPDRGDRDLFTDELKQAYLDASEFFASLTRRSFNSRNQNPREIAEQKFEQQKRRFTDRYISILRGEQEVLRKRFSELTDEEKALNSEFQKTENLINELVKQIQKMVSELKVEIATLQPAKQVVTSPSAPNMGPPPPPPPPLLPSLLGPGSMRQRKGKSVPPSQSADAIPSSSNSTAISIDDIKRTKSTMRTFSTSTLTSLITEVPAVSQAEVQNPFEVFRRSASFAGQSSSSSQPQSTVAIQPKKSTPTIEDTETDLSTLAQKVFHDKEEKNAALRERNRVQKDYYEGIQQQKRQLDQLKARLKEGIRATQRDKQELEEKQERKRQARKQEAESKRIVVVSSPAISASAPPPPPPPPPPNATGTVPLVRSLSMKDSLQGVVLKKADDKELSKGSSSSDSNPASSSSSAGKKVATKSLSDELKKRLAENRVVMGYDNPNDNEEERERKAEEEALKREKAEQELAHRHSILSKYRSNLPESSDILQAALITSQEISAKTAQIREQGQQSSGSQTTDDLQSKIDRLIEKLREENEQAALRAIEEEEEEKRREEEEEEEERLRTLAVVVQAPRTDVQPPRTNVQPPRTDVQPPRTNVQPPRTDVQAPRTAVQPPRTAVQPPRTAVQAPRTAVQAPRTAVQAPRTAVQAPSTAVQPPRTAVQPPFTARRSNTSPAATVKMPRIIKQDERLKAILDSGEKHDPVTNKLYTAINSASAEKLVRSTISDLLHLRNYVAKKANEIQSAKLSVNDKKGCNGQLSAFYEQAIAIRLSDASLAEQAQQLEQAINSSFPKGKKSHKTISNLKLREEAQQVVNDLIVGDLATAYEQLSDSIAAISGEKLPHNILTDLLQLRDYAAMKRNEIRVDSSISEEERELYNQELDAFYARAIAIRVSDEAPEQQRRQLVEAAETSFTHQNNGLRLFADAILVISCFAGIGLLVGGARKLSGRSFFFSDAATQREIDFKAILKDEEKKSDGTLFASPAA